MIALLLVGCAGWVFDAREMACEGDVQTESDSLRLVSFGDPSVCLVDIDGLRGVQRVLQDGTLELSGTELDLGVQGDPNLDLQWETRAEITIGRDAYDIRLASTGSGRLLLTADSIELDCEDCLLVARLGGAFALRLTGDRQSAVCIDDGFGTIEYGTGNLVLLGDFENATVEGPGLFLTDSTDDELSPCG